MNQRLTRHLVFWIVYWAFECYTQFEWIIRQNDVTAQRALFVAIASETIQVVPIKLLMVYSLFYFLSNYNNHKIDKRTLAVSMCLVMIVFTILAHILNVAFILPYIYDEQEAVGFFDYLGMMDTLMDKLFIAGVAIAIKQNSFSQKLQNRERILVKEKLEMELNFLKSQLNPHFLFNTLNNIYALALKKSDQTAQVVVKLSKLLRFVLYEAQANDIPIEREINFLLDYIELEKIRYGDRLTVSFDYQTDDKQACIMPLILVPFVENAFKHGASETTQTAFIKINLTLQNRNLSFIVENTYEPRAEKVTEGIGLKNLRRQLELRYPAFDLQTNADGSVFNAKLSIELNTAR